ncbi:hypothetical protein JVT61DRAFT_8082 [Boletus reticuloceps]|uniref:DEAD/DEAH-box helicase domain-containing protein n=1 Tax=Boletus reticuloceps TaxID=495285 RepID=A0A8I2YXV8_9AGAM|nr:hypothetical protein JVT61DRAFT_8082 [Boletus reticuloceps]
MATTSPNRVHPSTPVPSISDIRKCAEEILKLRPCLWQLKVVEALLKRDQDVLCIAGTGMGKTLTFWMPLLFRPDGIQIIVTPLNMLGKQNTSSIKAGIKAIAINSDTATPLSFQVSYVSTIVCRVMAYHTVPHRP